MRQTFTHTRWPLALSMLCTLMCGVLLVPLPPVKAQQHSNASVSSGKVLTSKDGAIQITVPNGWVVTTDLNDKAALQTAEPDKMLYLIVLTYNKSDHPSMTLESLVDITLKEIKEQVANPRAVGPTSLKIDGLPAIQHEVYGNFEVYGVVFKNTVVETPKHFQQIVVWTTQAAYAEDKETLENIITSFKQVTGK